MAIRKRKQYTQAATSKLLVDLIDLLICETLSLGRVEGKAYKNTPNKYNRTYTTQHRIKTNTYT